MIEPRPLRFADGWADSTLTGAPLIESVLRAFVGRCQVCGRAAERQLEGSVLLNPIEIDGTLYGDTFCLGCCEDEYDSPVFVLPPLDPKDEGDE